MRKCCDECPGDDTCMHADWCMCGSSMDHSPWEGHQPVSMHDYISEQREIEMANDNANQNSGATQSAPQQNQMVDIDVLRGTLADQVFTIVMLQSANKVLSSQLNEARAQIEKLTPQPKGKPRAEAA